MLTENFAHSGYQVKASNRTVAPQLYRDHIHAVRNNALREFDRRFRHYKNRKMVNFYRKILETATEWHDLGKLMPECQAILSQSSESDTSMLNHVDAGVSHCIKEYERTNELYYLLAAWLILAHHIGYIDWEELTKITLVNPSQMLSPTKIHLKEKWRDYRIRDYVDANLIIWEQLHKEDIIITDSMPDVGYNINIKNVDWFDISMCFSCMVSADHADTNQFYNDGYVLPEPCKLRINERIESLDKYADGLSKINPDERTKDRKLLFASADRESISSWIKNDGTVGSGKTNANHKKALKMANKYKCERIFIAVPYTNVINQLVGKAKESLLLPGEYLVGVINEHHSMVQFTDWWLRKYNNRLDGPLTYTTCVQYFEALATYHPAAIGKLIHFTDSVIVLDEYHQAMPYELWSHALFLLEKLVNNYNVHVIFSSGTPIDFWDLYHKNIVVDNMLTHTEWKHFQARENTRVKKSHLGAIGLGKLCRHITNGYKNKHSTLIVCNTTNNAKVLFKLLNSGNGNVYHLSSRVTPEFREKRLELIKQKIKDELPVILIATSMVECGIDISFERCYREETSLDSLQQCTGRCNRNNEFKIGKVYVFCFSESLIR
jgi:CRISPR-associated helicase Cas3